jgi:hypothetical protein
MADINFDRVAKALESPAYVAVGFGVLAFQRAQVRRRELQRQIGQLAQTVNESLAPSYAGVSESLVDNLPKEARDFLNAAGDLAHDLPREAGEAVKEVLAIGRLMLKMAAGPGGRRSYP